MQKKWHKKYVICSSDGIPIEDGSGTQGITVNIHYVICSFLSPAKENGKIFIDWWDSEERHEINQKL